MENNTRPKLKSIALSGFKSFGSVEQTVHFHDVTVLIGANGAGKSSLISFFKMLNFIMTDALNVFVEKQGYASSLLHLGPKTTAQIKSEIKFSDGRDIDTYKFTLSHASRDSLIFTEELISYSKAGRFKPFIHEFDPGKNKSGLKEDNQTQTVKRVSSIVSILLNNCKVFQFHDTSEEARIRNSGYINDNGYLRSDAGNLAAFLFGLKEVNVTLSYYEKIVRHIKAAFPQFEDFVLRPSARNENYIMLDWKEQTHKDYVFGPHQLSDGTIRFMALAALLLQPPPKLPPVIVIDEPELGLHPSAIIELASMVKIASKNSQIVLATQSPTLLDEFNPEQVVVIERDPLSQSSIIKEFTSEQLEYWLKEYTLSEIWDKNILGGNP